MAFVFDLFFWLLVGFVALAAVILLSLYIRGAFQWQPLVRIERSLAPQDPRFLTVVKSLTRSQETTGHFIGFWHSADGSADDIQKARLSAIQSARCSIQFETFMMTPGRRANDFAAAIAQKAAEGVSVQMLVDQWGTRSLSERYWQKLRAAGVQIVFFNSFDWRAPANYAGRTHRKLLLIDSNLALTGGAGISDLWDGTEKSDDTQPWLDIEAAVTGNVVNVLSAIFQSHWQGHRLHQSKASAIDMGVVYPDLSRPARPNSSALTAADTTFDFDRDAVFDRTEKARTEKARTERTRTEKAETERAAHKTAILVTPGTRPSYRDSSLEMLKQTLIACARQRLWLSSPYFLPNRSSRHLLIAAQQSGVDVRILTTSDRSDKKPVYYASYEMYGPLLKAGIKIFEYQPSMLHAKMLIVDDDWVNTGSANFDYRSFLHNDELDLMTSDQTLIKKVEAVFKAGFEQSDQIGLRQWQRRSWLKHRILGNIVRLVQWQL